MLSQYLSFSRIHTLSNILLEVRKIDCFFNVITDIRCHFEVLEIAFTIDFFNGMLPA